ncbi:hypothetical protein P5673_032769, partial [Acropora cervicornis]
MELPSNTPPQYTRRDRGTSAPSSSYTGEYSAVGREEKKTKKQTKKDNNKKNDETIVDEVVEKCEKEISEYGKHLVDKTIAESLEE